MSSNNRNNYKDSLLILNWVYPDVGPYDVEAIEKLKPIRIFTIYENSGTAGSRSFHENFKDSSKKYGYKSNMKQIIKNKDDESLEYVIESYKRIK